MTLSVIFSEGAWQDFDEIYDWIADQAGPEIARAYTSRIDDFCSGLCDFPNRGSPRDDLAPGVRTVAFEGRAIIAYSVDHSEVRIVRILHHGRDASSAFRT